MNTENPSRPPFDSSESLKSAENFLRHLVRIGKRRAEASGADPGKFRSAEHVLNECAEIIRQAKDGIQAGPDAGQSPNPEIPEHPLVAEIRSKIIRLPGRPPAMLDRDLAEIYGTETKALNKAAKRNLKRFPGNFRFQLTENELEILRFQIGTSNNQSEQRLTSAGGTRYFPWAYSREGSNMLSAVLHTGIAIDRSVHIMIAFSALEEAVADGCGGNLLLSVRLRSLESAIGRLGNEMRRDMDRLFEGWEKTDAKTDALTERLDAEALAEKRENFAEARFLKEVCETRDPAARSPKTETYDLYRAFCELNGYEPAAKNHFFKILYRLSPQLRSGTLTVRGKRVSVVKGLGLR